VLKRIVETAHEVSRDITYTPCVGEILVLKATGRQILAKRFAIVDDTVVGKAARPPYKSTPSLLRADTLLDLREALREIQRDRAFALCLFAELNEEGERLARAGTPIRRKSEGATSLDDDLPTLKDSPKCFVSIDIDDLAIPDSADYVEYTDRDAPLLALPSNFHDVSFVRQLSSSAGVKSRREGTGRIVKAHYFFTLVDERGAPRYVTREWWKAYMLHRFPRMTTHNKSGEEVEATVADSSINSRGRMLFTALALRGVGVPNDFADNERVELIENTYPAVIISDELHAEIETLIDSPDTRHLNERDRKLRERAKKSMGAKRTRRNARAQVRPCYSALYPPVRGERETLHAILAKTRMQCEEIERGRRDLLKKCSWAIARAVNEGNVGFDYACEVFPTFAQEMRAESLSEYTRLLDSAFDCVLLSAPIISAPDRDHTPSTSAEINEVARDVVKRGVSGAIQDTSSVHVVKLPTGAGKSSAAIEEAVKLSARRPVIFALATRALAEEKLRAANAIERARGAISLYLPRAHRLKSRVERCDTLAESGERGDRARALYVLSEASLSTSEHSFCAAFQCPLFGKCGAQVPDSTKLNGLTFTTHELLNQIAEDRLPPNALLIYDETPTLHYKDNATSEELRALTTHPDARVTLLAREACSALVLMEGEHATLSSAFNALPSSRLDAIKRAALALNEGGGEIQIATPQELLESLDRGNAHTLFTPNHRRLIKHIINAVLETTPLEMVRRAYQRGHAAQETLELHRTWRPREVAGAPLSTLILDATPPVDIARISEMHARGYVEHAPPTGAIKGEISNAYHRMTSALNNRALFNGGDTLCGDHGGIARAAEFVRERLSGNVDPGSRVAVITNKRLRGALERGGERAYQLDAERESLSEALSPYVVEYGHYGADSRASNRFEECDALVILGTFKLDYTEQRARLRAMGIDADDATFKAYAKQNAQDELEQAIGRARTWRRECPVIYVGNIEARCAEDEGIIWERGSCVGRPTKYEDTREEARARLERGFPLTSRDLRRFGMDRRRANDILRELYQEGGGEKEGARYVWEGKEGRLSVLQLNATLMDDALDRFEEEMHSERFSPFACLGVIAEMVDEALDDEPVALLRSYVDPEQEEELLELIETANEDEQRVGWVRGEKGVFAFRDTSGCKVNGLPVSLVRLLEREHERKYVGTTTRALLMKTAQRDLRSLSPVSAIIESIKRKRERATAEHVPF